MAEAAIDPQEAYATREAARAADRARMKRIGSYHFAMVMASLTLWGAAQAWAQVTGWGIAQFAAIANALIAGTIIPSVIHEWGHFAGARLMGFAEGMALLSSLRLGAETGVLPGQSIRQANELLLSSQKAHIEMAAGQDCDELALSMKRADLFRAAVAGPGGRPEGPRPDSKTATSKRN